MPKQVPAKHWLFCFLLSRKWMPGNLYIYFACLSVRLYSKNVKTTELIGPKIVVATDMTQGMIYGWLKVKKIEDGCEASKNLSYCKFVVKLYVIVSKFLFIFLEIFLFFQKFQFNTKNFTLFYLILLFNIWIYIFKYDMMFDTRSSGGRERNKQINCLVLAPTRELATQIQVFIFHRG